MESIGSEDATTVAWGNLVANANDIIQYSSSAGEWQVSFDSENSEDIEFVTNITTNVQYRFVDGTWMKSVEGWYDQGDWSVVI